MGKEHFWLWNNIDEETASLLKVWNIQFQNNWFYKEIDKKI